MSFAAGWWSTFGLCIVSALIPVVNAEIILLGAVAMAPSALALPLAAAAALGQMVGKLGVYYAGRGALRLPGKRLQRAIADARAKAEAHEGMETTVYFLSAVFGFPPYYLVTITSGLLRFPLGRFIVLGLLGRFIRFGVLALVPELLPAWIPWRR